MDDRRKIAATLAVITTFLAFVAIAGSSRLFGPVLVEFTPRHGIHADDLVVVAVWAWAMSICWRLGHRSSDGPTRGPLA